MPPMVPPQAGTNPVMSSWQQSAAPLAPQFGVPLGYLQRLAQSESGNRNIRQQVNATGTAFGPFQFTEGTWNDLINNHPELGLTPADRFLPAAQGRAIVVHTADNQKLLQTNLGRAPSAADLALAHRFGVQGALALLKAKPHESVANILPAAAAANPQWARLSAGDVIDETGKVVAGPGASEQPQAGPGASAQPQPQPQPAVPQPDWAALIGGTSAPTGGFDNLTPQMREILAIAIRNPTIGPHILGALVQSELSPRNAPQGPSMLTERAKNALVAGLRPGTKEFQQFMLSEGGAPESTSAQKDALALGLQPGTDAYNDYIRQRTLKPGVAVTVNPTIDTGRAAPVNEAVQKRYEAAIAGGDAARNKLSQIDAAEAALSNLPTGKGAETLAQISGYLRAFGIDPAKLNLPDTASAAQVMASIINPMVLELRNPSGGAGMPGALSDADREFLTKSVIGIEKTPQANSAILMLQRRMAQRQLDLENLAITHTEEHNGNVAPSFLREVKDFAAKNPLFDEDFRKRYNALIKSPAPSISAAPAQAPTPTTQAILGASQDQLRAWLSDPTTGDAILADPALKGALDQRLGRR